MGRTEGLADRFPGFRSAARIIVSPAIKLIPLATGEVARGPAFGLLRFHSGLGALAVHRFRRLVVFIVRFRVRVAHGAVLNPGLVLRILVAFGGGIRSADGDRLTLGIFPPPGRIEGFIQVISVGSRAALTARALVFQVRIYGTGSTLRLSQRLGTSPSTATTS